MKKLIVLFMICLCSMGRSQGLLTNLRGCYSMDCNSAANSATTGSSYNGVINGNVTCANGHLNAANTAYNFGGTSSDYVDIPNPSLIKSTNEITISGWFKVNSYQNQSYITAIYTQGGVQNANYIPAWDLNIQVSGNSHQFATNRYSFTRPSSVVSSLNTWYHVVIYWSTTKGIIWVNNVKDSMVFSQTPITYPSGATPVTLGSNNVVNWTSTFNGAIDNLRFYDRRLSAAEITDLYTNDPTCASAGANAPPPPPPAPGNVCGSTPNPMTANQQIPMNNFNYNFTNPLNSPSKVMVGFPTCNNNGVARLHVNDDNIGNAIFANCITANNDNIAIRGYAGDPNSTTSNNIFGILGEANLNPANTSGSSAGVVGFCGPFSPGFIPPGRNIGVYGNSVANAGRWAGYFDGDVQFNGTVWGSQFWWGSDKRLKNNIHELGGVTAKLKNIKSYTYLYNTEKFKKRNLPVNEQIGFLAQELEDAFPQLVTKDDHDYLAVNYVGFIPVLLQAHKEQQEQIDQQAAALKDQQKEIDELKKLLMPNGLKTDGSMGLNNKLSVTLSDGNAIVLNQNVPNPFAESTVITYNLPGNFSKAEIIFTTDIGIVIKTVPITSHGKGSLTVYADDLSNGVYTYTLVVDGITKDTKNMVKQ